MSIEVKLTQPDKEQVQTTSVKDVVYSCDYTVPEDYDNDDWGRDPEGNVVYDSTKAVLWVSSGAYYGDITISWSFSPGDDVSNGTYGTHTFSLDTDPGKEVTIKATAILSYSRYIWQTVYVRDDLESAWTQDRDSSYNEWDRDFTDYSDPASCTVYTRPGVFTEYNFEADKTPVCGEEGLNKDRIQAWCDHCGKFLSWKNQEDCYDDANDCTLNAKYVTASWFNKQAEICGAGISVEVNDIIKASLFKTLGKAISKEDD